MRGEQSIRSPKKKPNLARSFSERVDSPFSSRCRNSRLSGIDIYIRVNPVISSSSHRQASQATLSFRVRLY